MCCPTMSEIQANDLPNEILQKIFEFCSIKERMSLARVCHKWMKMSLIGIKQIHLKSEMQFSLDNRMDQTIIWKSVSDLNTIEFKLNTKKLDGIVRLLRYIGTYLQAFVFGFDCSELASIDSKGQLLEGLMQHCPNLTTLKFHSFHRSELELLLQKYGQQLEELEPLPCKKVSFQTLMPYLNPIKLRILGLDFINQSDLRLVCETFVFLTVLKIWDDSENFSSSLDFSPLKGLKYLQELSLGRQEEEIGLRNFDWMNTNAWSQTLISLELAMQLQMTSKRMITLKKLLQLRNLKIVVSTLEQVCFVCNNLQNLTRLSIDFSLDRRRTIFPVFSKLIKLKYFSICFEPDCLWPIPVLFEHCSLKSVEFFSLACPNHYNDEFDFQTFKLNVNRFIQILPQAFPNVKKFEIWGCWIFGPTLCSCLTRMCQLKTFICHATGYVQEVAQEETNEKFVMELQVCCRRNQIDSVFYF